MFPSAPVPNARTISAYWLPPILWMTLIFWGSTDALSTRRTSRIIGPILRWFDPNVRQETIEGVQTVVRKTAHMTEYGVLALLYWRALYRPGVEGKRVWSRRAAVTAFVLAVAYAASDEFHQSFVASREGSVRDVGFDSAGALVALVALWLIGRRLGWWRPAEPAPEG